MAMSSVARAWARVWGSPNVPLAEYTSIMGIARFLSEGSEAAGYSDAVSFHGCRISYSLLG